MKYDLILISFFFKEFISCQGNTEIIIKKQTFHHLMVDSGIHLNFATWTDLVARVVFYMYWCKKTNYQGIMWLKIKWMQLVLRDYK